MSVNFNAVFDNATPFTATFTTPDSLNADFQRLISVSDTTATADDVMDGKVFYNADGIRTIGNYIWDFKGFRPRLLIPNLYSFSTKLADTGFATWTPSTTASAIVTADNVTTFVANMVDYEYLIHWKCTFDAVYPSGTTLKAAPIREIADIWQVVLRRPNSINTIESESFVGNGCVTMSTTPLNVYYNSSGVKSYTYSISYGIYPAAAAATFSSSTSNTPTVTVKRPSYNSRCSSTYFSTARAGDIDQDESMIKIRGELWMVPIGSTMRSLYESLIDLYNNPI